MPNLPIPALQLPQLPQQGQPPAPQPMQAPQQLPQQQTAPAQPNVLWTDKAPPQPKPGDIINGHKYLGGPPANDQSWQPLMGQDYLSALPQDRQNIVKNILMGKNPLPQGTVLKDPYWKQIYSDVVTAEPDFNGAVAKSRAALLQDFNRGKTAQQIQALRMGIHHAAGMQEAYDNLDNHDAPPLVNSIANGVESWMPTAAGARVRSAMAAANLNSRALGSETAAIMQGGPPHETEIGGYQSDYSPNAGPSASNAALGKAASLFNDRLQTIQQKWRDGMGPLAGDYPVIDGTTQGAWNKLTSRYDPATGEVKQPQAKAASASQPGLDPQSIANELRRRGVIK